MKWNNLMAILNFKRKTAAAPVFDGNLAHFLNGFSIEVMPRTAAKIDDFRKILPEGTRVYVAHIEGTPIEEMVETAKRISDDGFPVMPHFPARIIKDAATLEEWINRYADVGISQALLLAGGVDKPHGDFQDSMQLLGTGLFDKHNFKRLHVAGHPEGNKDIDPKGGDQAVMDALRWKNDFQNRTDAKMALATQFVFESAPVIEWANRLQAEGIDIPIHIGVAGPAKLQTMIKFAISCQTICKNRLCFLARPKVRTIFQIVLRAGKPSVLECKVSLPRTPVHPMIAGVRVAYSFQIACQCH